MLEDGHPIDLDLAAAFVLAFFEKTKNGAILFYMRCVPSNSSRRAPA